MTEMVSGTENESWIARARGVSSARVRLICLPHAGAGAAGYYRWRRLLPAWIEVCPVLLPGRETRLGEAPMLSVDGVVEKLLEAMQQGDLLDRPYALYGHSMGSLIAYEWARALQLAGLRAPVKLIVSGREAPQVPFGHREYHRMEDQALLDALQGRYGGVSEAMFTVPELRALFLPILRADMTLVETYRWRAEPMLACPVEAFAGVLDTSASDVGLDRWGEVTTGSFRRERIGGDHFFNLGEGQSELLARIESAVSGL